MTTLVMPAVTANFVAIKTVIIVMMAFMMLHLVVPISVTANIGVAIQIRATLDVINPTRHIRSHISRRINWRCNRCNHGSDYHRARMLHHRCNVDLRQRSLNHQLRWRDDQLRPTLHVLHVLDVMWPRLR